ncbi:MAG: hypothetical protein CMG32_02565 [Candidatus Marinimicrobia bacterium]|nr:hypothetical protein [Candidatus Neomarinimicrobiota bacterium]
MLKLSIVIKYYLLSFLLIDSISGFVRIYLGISNPIFNIGYWIRGPILILLFFYYLIQLKNRKLFIDEFISLIIFAYFIFNLFLNYTIAPSSRMFTENIPYILRQQFLLFLLVFIRNRMELDESLTRKVIYFNFIIFAINLFIGYMFGFGLEVYEFSNTSKGMFQSGNPVSILNLIFFTFFILDGKFRKRIVPIAITLFNGFVIATKSIFGFIIPIFFALRRKALSINKLIFYTLLIFSIIITFSSIIDITMDAYETRFGVNINKSIDVTTKIGGLYKSEIMNSIASINFRRYASLNVQMEESLSNYNTFLIGKSLVGQNVFWEKRGEFRFKNSSMDFFDFFFKYGLIGTVLFIFLLMKDIMPAIKKSITRDKVVISLFFVYSFFGGHVIDSVTSGSFFYYYLAKIKS